MAQAAVADVAEPRERARLFGLLGAAFGLGFVAGPAIGALAALGGSRLPFLVAAALAAANALVAVRRLPETNRRTATAPHDLPPVVVADGLGVEGLGGLDPGAAVDPEPFIAPETSPVRRLLGPSPLSRSAPSRPPSPSSASAGSTPGPPRRASSFTGVGLVLALVQGVLVHPTVHRLGELRTLRLGFAINAVGLLLLAAVHSWWVLVPALLALVLGQGLATPSLTAAVAGARPPSAGAGCSGCSSRPAAWPGSSGPWPGAWPSSTWVTPRPTSWVPRCWPCASCWCPGSPPLGRAGGGQ